MRANEGGGGSRGLMHVEPFLMQLGAAGFYLGQVEDPIDLGQEMMPGIVDVLGIGADLNRCDLLPALGQQMGEADDRVERRAQLMAHIRQELGLRPVGGLGAEHCRMHDLGIALGFLAGGNQAHFGMPAADENPELAGILGQQRSTARRWSKIRSHPWPPLGRTARPPALSVRQPSHAISAGFG